MSNKSWGRNVKLLRTIYSYAKGNSRGWTAFIRYKIRPLVHKFSRGLEDITDSDLLDILDSEWPGWMIRRKLKTLEDIKNFKTAKHRFNRRRKDGD